MSTAHIPLADLVAIAHKRYEAGNYQRTGGYHRAMTLNAEADELERKHGLEIGSTPAAPQYQTGDSLAPEETGEIPAITAEQRDLFA